MYCQNCKPLVKLVESNLPAIYYDGMFEQDYYCFSCNILYTCTSQSGDMIQENLNITNE